MRVELSHAQVTGQPLAAAAHHAVVVPAEHRRGQRRHEAHSGRGQLDIPGVAHARGVAIALQFRQGAAIELTAHQGNNSDLSQHHRTR